LEKSDPQDQEKSVNKIATRYQVLLQKKFKNLLVCAAKKRMDLRNRAMLYFLYDTGIRVSEMCDLKIEDVNIQTGQVNILDGKGGFSGTVFISTKCKRELLKYLRHRLKLHPGDAYFSAIWQSSHRRG